MSIQIGMDNSNGSKKINMFFIIIFTIESMMNVVL